VRAKNLILIDEDYGPPQKITGVVTYRDDDGKVRAIGSKLAPPSRRKDK